METPAPAPLAIQHQVGHPPPPYPPPSPPHKTIAGASAEPLPQDPSADDEEDRIMKKKKSSASNLHALFMVNDDPLDGLLRLGLQAGNNALLHDYTNRQQQKHQEQHFHSSSRRSISRHAERLSSMGVLNIMRESSSLLRANSSALMYIMILLISPVSVLLLSHAFLQGDLAHRLSSRLYKIATAAGLLSYTSMVKFMYSSVSQTFLTYAFSAPALFTLWLLAKASITFTVSCTYAGKKMTFSAAMSAAVKLWKRLACTYFWISVIVMAFCSTATLLFLLLISFLDALKFSADLIFLTELALALFYSVIFAQMVVTGSLANVVCILEEHYGLSALVKSVHLIKGRIQVALSLFLAVTLCTAMVESLYQYRVIGVPESRYAINTASRMWEGPLLVLMYSFLWVMDAIMSCVFYFTCQYAVLDKQEAWETVVMGPNSTDLA